MRRDNRNATLYIPSQLHFLATSLAREYSRSDCAEIAEMASTRPTSKAISEKARSFMSHMAKKSFKDHSRQSSRVPSAVLCFFTVVFALHLQIPNASRYLRLLPRRRCIMLAVSLCSAESISANVHASACLHNMRTMASGSQPSAEWILVEYPFLQNV